MEELWDKFNFKGKANTKELLEIKAKVLAPSLYLGVQFSAREICKGIDEATEMRQFFFVLLETFALYLHLADRISFNLLGPEFRAIFMDALMTETLAAVKLELGDDAQAYSATSQGVIDIYNHRQPEFAGYRMQAEGNSSVQGTLPWEFGLIVAVRLEKPEELGATLNSAISAFVGFDNLRVGELLSPTK